MVRRTIDKWLAAGVMEGTQLTHPDAGTPQGGVVSPMLANVYLHDALDKWFERDAKPRLRGRARMVRFADDLVMVFTNEKDARRVLDVLPRRLGKYGLTLHPTKSRLLYFRPPSAGGDQPRDTGKQSFDFLGTPLKPQGNPRSPCPRSRPRAPSPVALRGRARDVR